MNTTHTQKQHDKNPVESVPLSNSPLTAGSSTSMLGNEEQGKSAAEVLIEGLCQAALIALVRIGGVRVKEAGSDQLDKVCIAMRKAAMPIFDRMMADARETIGIEDYVFLNAALDLAKVGLDALPSA